VASVPMTTIRLFLLAAAAESAPALLLNHRHVGGTVMRSSAERRGLVASDHQNWAP